METQGVRHMRILSVPDTVAADQNSPLIGKVGLRLYLYRFLGRLLRHGAFLVEQIGRLGSSSDSSAKIVDCVHG